MAPLVLHVRRPVGHLEDLSGDGAARSRTDGRRRVEDQKRSVVRRNGRLRMRSVMTVIVVAVLGLRDLPLPTGAREGEAR